ncbi:hypothetical protein EU537_01595 [Candidatus Thorarchaeota archaeon]|nr:MAG: hypothetical protein EU537_01595 [Candidatus Thorarchaeota archaeon]
MNVEEAIDGKVYTTWEEIREAVKRVEEMRKNGENVLLDLTERSTKRAVGIGLFNEEELEDYLSCVPRRSMMYQHPDSEEPLPTTVRAIIVDATDYERL